MTLSFPTKTLALLSILLKDAFGSSSVVLYPAQLGTFSPVATPDRSLLEVKDTFDTTCFDRTPSDRDCIGSFTLDLSTSNIFTFTVTVPNDDWEIELDPTAGRRAQDDSRDPGDPLFVQFVAKLDPPPNDLCRNEQSFLFSDDNNMTTSIMGSNVDGLAVMEKQTDSYEYTRIDIDTCGVTVKLAVGGGQYSANPPYRFKELSVSVPFDPSPFEAVGPQTYSYESSLNYGIVWTYKGATKIVGPGAPPPPPSCPSCPPPLSGSAAASGGAALTSLGNALYLSITILGILGIFQS